MMRRFKIATSLLVCIGIPAAARPPERCPVLLQNISLTYNHNGGKSTPQLQVKFANDTGVELAKATFQLSVLDAAGYPQIYANDFEFRGALAPRKSKISSWDLDANSVDIHRTGETVLLKSVTFADGNGWADDGSETCRMTVDFHAQ